MTSLPPRPRPRTLTVLLTVATMLAAQFAMAGPARAAFDPTAIRLVLHRVASGLERPILVTHAGDGSGRRFIVEQPGRVRVLTAAGTLLATPLIDISTSVSKGGEQGLLGLAFHPDHETNGKFYVNFTRTNGDTVINEYRVGTNPNRVLSGSGRRIMTIAQPYSNHNGGHMAFGPDGNLYIGTGDGGSGGDPGNRAQSLNSLHGKILRIDINGTTSTRAYRIPSTNPYVGRSGLDEIWSRGLRNPWRWSIDRVTGVLFIGDVGQGRYEEINRSIRGSWPVGGRGVNYGWPVLEGNACYRPSSGCSTSGKIKPVIVYRHLSGRCSVTGGYIYRGNASPLLARAYLYGDFCTGEIWGFDTWAANPQSSAIRLRDTAMRISSFGEDEAGELYVVDLNGAVYRISATAA